METDLTRPDHSYSAGGVIIGPNNKVAVVSQHGTSWSLVKGTLEEGENLKTAAIREFEEETGITKIKFIKQYPSYDRYIIGKHGGEDPRELKTITMFLCETPEIDLKPQDPENPEAIWVDPDKVAQLLTHPKDKAFYEGVHREVLEFIKARMSDNK
jgi:8-oxo-dGTP pyrophosphatase MutT (NUDIX family)